MAAPVIPLVRPYEPADRAAVRHICFVTGLMGEPVAGQWRDEESFADLFSSYYTDREPESAPVVELDGSVQGYLLGCVDTARSTSAATIAARHVLRRGIAFRPGTAAVVWRSVGDVASDLARRRITVAQLDFADLRWPAHLHIDLLSGARGRGVGARLVRHWLDRLRSMSVAGCHLQTVAENATAVAFFEAMGFTTEGEPIVVPGLRTPDGGRHHVALMVQRL